jgi:outer membrane lipoprotein-sorting protein
MTRIIQIKTMKKILIIITVLLSISASAQNNSDKARDLLDEVLNNVKSYQNISIDFKYVLINTEEGINQETRGDVVMEENKYVLNILGITRIFDGDSLYTISPEDEEVTISTETSEDANTITPSEMLSFYQEGYTYAVDSIQNLSGRKIQYVKLVPIDSNSEISYVLLGIDNKTQHIYKLIEVGNNGTRTELTVNSFKTNQPLSKSLFIFDKSKYKDYFINTID